jgi:hypothetical protein
MGSGGDDENGGDDAEGLQKRFDHRLERRVR